MKTTLVKSTILVAIILSSCSSPNFNFYHSEASIPSKSDFIVTKFTMIREISESLPFGVIAALDKRNSTEVTEYVLLAPNLPYDYSVIENVEDYIHPYHVTLNIVKIKELISKIDEAIRFIGTPWEAEKGINIEYSIIEEHNITPLSINVEEWNSNFVFIFKGFSKTDQSFVKLGFLRSQKGNITYSYYLNKKMLMEFRLRLYKALEELKKMK